MASSRIWIETAIPGFMYLFAGLFLGLTLLGIHDLSFLLPIKDLLPYLAAGALALSLVLGFIARRAVQFAGGLVFPAIERFFRLQPLPASADARAHFTDLIDVWQYGSERLQQELEFLFAMHALFQSLVVAVPLLGASLVLWTATGDMISVALILAASTVALTPLTYVVYRTQRRNLSITQDVARTAVAAVKAAASTRGQQDHPSGGDPRL